MEFMLLFPLRTSKYVGSQRRLAMSAVCLSNLAAGWWTWLLESMTLADQHTLDSRFMGPKLMTLQYCLEKNVLSKGFSNVVVV